MINESEVDFYIDSQLPNMPHCPHSAKSVSHVYESISGLSDFLKQKFAEHDLVAVKKICYVAEYLYNKDSNTVKNGIEHVFIYSISAIMPAERQARRELQAIMPITIFSVYVQQVLRSRN